MMINVFEKKHITVKRKSEYISMYCTRKWEGDKGLFGDSQDGRQKVDRETKMATAIESAADRQ